MTVLSSFVESFNTKYGTTKPVNYAKDLFKQNIDVGQAVVSVLSNTGIAGFKFHIPLREQIKMESEATDHYVADNAVVQDNIILKPITITLNGLQGDYFYSVNEIEDALALVVPTLRLVQHYLPKLSAATMQIKQNWAKNQEAQQGLSAYYASYDKSVPFNDRFKTAMDTLNGVDLFKLFQELYKLKSAQTRAFFYLSALWQAKMCFTVETTFRRFDSMMITSLTPIRDENADITDFTVTFKQIRKTQSLVTNLYDKYGSAGRVQQQTAKTVNKGVVKGKEVSVNVSNN